LQVPPMLVLQPSSPELALVLFSLDDTNEKLKGSQSTDVEAKPPPSRVGNHEVSRDLEGGPSPRDITREL
jgi:hypothetical protein